MFDFNKHLVTESLPNQVPNSTGGYAFVASNLLDRFLILGTEGGSYYITERDLTKENVTALAKALAENPITTIDKIVEISEKGRCIKNETCIFALAYAAGHPNVAARKHALRNLSKVCRTGTHLFQFMEYVKHFRGRGRLLKEALQFWYLDKRVDSLEYQMVKYQSRNGWSHKDVLRLCKPSTLELDRNLCFRWAVGKDVCHDIHEGYIRGFMKAKGAKTVADINYLIEEYHLTREMIPTEWLNNAGVWPSLIHNTPYIALVRNLGAMTACGYITPLSDAARVVVTRLLDPRDIKNSKVHPIQILMAYFTYKMGRGLKGSLVWTPNQQVLAALENAFMLSFDNVKPTGKKYFLALDISGSMGCGNIGGIEGFTPRIASAVLAMVTLRSESQCYVAGFSHTLIPLNINAASSLDDVVREISGKPFGNTNIGLPVESAIAKKMDVDAFIVYTDNEANRGSHASELLKHLPGAKMAVVAMTANKFSVSDPTNPNMCDFVGFDSSTPAAVSAFVGM